MADASARPPRRLDWRQLKDLVDVETVAAALLGPPIRREGERLKYLCPFHDDHDPSLAVSVERRDWRCWSCGVRGDAFGLVMRLEGLTFPEAVRRTAELCGLATATGEFRAPSRPKPAKARGKPKTRSGGPRRDWAERSVDDAAARLWTPTGRPGLEHLRGRGFHDETIRRFRLGWFDEEVPRRNPGPGERPTWRCAGISIPWFDGGRLTRVKVRRPDVAKGRRYLVPWQDRPTLFPDPDAIAPDKPLALCEGELDCVLLTQEIGDLAAAVSLGSAGDFKRAGIDDDLLGRIVSRALVLIAPDADEAGDDAAEPWLNLENAVRVRPPSPAKDWCEAHALGFNVVRNHWRRSLRDDLPPREELETWRGGPALDREPPELGAEPDADDERERAEERRAIAEADG